MSTFQDLMTIMREDYLSDTFDGIDTATTSEIDANVLWKERQLLRFLIESQEEACMRGDLIHDDEVTVDLIESQRTYDFNPIMMRVDHVRYNDKPVTHISKDNLRSQFPDWKTKTGIGDNELFYYMTGFKFNLYPIPDATDIALNPEVEIDGYRLPNTDILQNDDLEIPLNMHKNVIWYALHMAYAMADADALNYKESLVYMNKFDSAFGPKLDNRVVIHQLENPKQAWIGPIDYTGGDNKYDQWNS